MFRLICIDGLAVGEELPILNELTTLGRNDDNDICVLDSEVSRHHCRITRNEHDLTVKDLGSRNGLYVNEVYHKDEHTLKPSDLLRLGNTTYMLYDDDNPPANYDEIKNILAKVPKAPHEVMMNILSLQMSQTIVLPRGVRS